MRKGLKAFKDLMLRELLLVQRLAFVYVFKAVQFAIVAIIVATMFLRTHIHTSTISDASLKSGFFFFSLLQTFFSGVNPCHASCISWQGLSVDIM